MREKWVECVINKDYEVSNLGNVRSLKRGMIRMLNKNKGVNVKRRNTVGLYDNGVERRIKVKKLVAMEFLGFVNNGKWVVQCIDGNEDNVNVYNLRIVSLREILSKGKNVGVSYCKDRNQYRARIFINGKHKSLGYYNTIKEAVNKYKIALFKWTMIDKKG